MIHIFLANGFEDIEALTPLDVLRRAGLDVQLVSISSGLEVKSSHGVRVVADATLDSIDLSDSEAMIIPGGMPGASNLRDNLALRKALQTQNAAERLVCAICAGPLVLSAAGILKERKATCYPGFEGQLPGAIHSTALVEEDGNIITGRGPGAAMDFAFAILKRFISRDVVKKMRQGMILE